MNSISLLLTASGVLLTNLSLAISEFAKTGWVAYRPSASCNSLLADGDRRHGSNSRRRLPTLCSYAHPDRLRRTFARGEVARMAVAALVPFGAFVNERALRRGQALLDWRHMGD